MFSSVRNVFHKIRGETWEDTELSSGIEYRIVFNRSGKVTDVILRHMPSYQKSHFADVMGSLRIDVTYGNWSALVDYASSKGQALRQPVGYDFDRKRDRVFYSLDGATFSIPRHSVEEIDARLSSLR